MSPLMLQALVVTLFEATVRSAPYFFVAYIGFANAMGIKKEADAPAAEPASAVELPTDGPIIPTAWPDA